MKRITVTLGQDTPAYASFEFDVVDDATNEDIINRIQEQAENQAGDLVFEPSYDFSGLRVVSAAHVRRFGGIGDTIVEDLPIEPSPEDIGIVAMAVLKGTLAPNQLIMEAERQGVAINPEVASMFERLTFSNEPMKSSSTQKMRG
jgi:hypothetical protein